MPLLQARLIVFSLGSSFLFGDVKMRTTIASFLLLPMSDSIDTFQRKLRYDTIHPANLIIPLQYECITQHTGYEPRRCACIPIPPPLAGPYWNKHCLTYVSVQH